jgi:TDG/mug DNA glycosylase family protein
MDFRTVEQWRGRRIETLADIIAEDLDVLIVGINPSPVSVALGHYHQGRLGRRMWALLHDWGILPVPAPGTFADELLLERNWGIADLSKWPSPRATLPRDEIAYGARILQAKIERFRPRLLLAVYRLPFEAILGPALPRGFGLLPGAAIGGSRIFKLPFPYQSKETIAQCMPDLKALLGS